MILSACQCPQRFVGFACLVLLYMAAGRTAASELVSCEHGEQRVSVLTRRGGKRTLANTIEGKQFNRFSDCTIDKRGFIYFTNPPYGLSEGAMKTKTRAIAWHGIYRNVAAGGGTLLSKEMIYPRGITLSTDEKTFYVAQSVPQVAIWQVFPEEINKRVQ